MAEQIPDLKVIAVPHLFPGEIQFANIKVCSERHVMLLTTTHHRASY